MTIFKTIKIILLTLTITAIAVFIGGSTMFLLNKLHTGTKSREEKQNKNKNKLHTGTKSREEKQNKNKLHTGTKSREEKRWKNVESEEKYPHEDITQNPGFYVVDEQGDIYPSPTQNDDTGIFNPFLSPESHRNVTEEVEALSAAQ